MDKRYLLLFLFFVLMFFALMIRVYHIGEYGLFGDEKQSALIAVGNTNIGGMVALMNPDSTFTPSDFWSPRGIQAWLDVDARGDVSGNSLFHDMALKLTAWVFGKSDGALRGVSVLFNMLTLLVMYLWAKKNSPKLIWALAVLALAAMEPFFVIFSQQARNYTTSLFFTTLSNYYFWMIIHPKDSDKIKNSYFIGWALASLGALFSTYLTALVLVGQLIYTFFYWPQNIVVKRFLMGIVFILIPFGWWMIKGPGQYFLAYQADAALQYRNYLSANGPIEGWIEPSTPINLFKRTLTILSDQWVWTNNLYTTFGFKIGSVILFFFGFFVRRWLIELPKNRRKWYVFGLLQISLPVVVLFFSAIKAQTTTGYFLRYASFGLPFGVFISIGFLEYVLKQHVWIKLIAGIFLFTQIYICFSFIRLMYKDKKQKYTFSVNRGTNPYPMIAQKIREQYQQGDTVYYPSKFNNLLNSPHMAKLNVDVVDAQLVNLYLDSNDQFIQRIDLSLKDSVLIRGKNGRRLLIFDFDKGRFRY